MPSSTFKLSIAPPAQRTPDNGVLDLSELGSLQVRVVYTPLVSTPSRTRFPLPARQVCAGVGRPDHVNQARE